jgi:tetratricopeptide (TPR) repeat protein
MTVVSTDFGARGVYRFGAPFDVQAAVRVAWTCALSPNTVGDSKQAVEVLELAQKAAKRAPEDYPAARSLGAALHRAGKHAEAVEQLQAALALRKTPSPSVWALLALSHHALEDKEKARHWLDRVDTWLEDVRKAPPDGQAPMWDRLPWTERFAVQALHREAAALLKGEAR